MRIALIDPGSKKLLFNENFPHIGLAYIAAVLEQHGHTVRCLDVGLEGEAATDRFLREGFDLFGLSVTSFTLRQAVDLAEKAKAINPDVPIVLGGPHVSIGMEETLDSPCVDFAIQGEGEFALLELVGLLEQGRGDDAESLAKIGGLIFRHDGRGVANPGRQRITDLDALPFPAFHLFPMERYGMYPLVTSRGCPFGCTFCSITAVWGTLWKYRSPESVIREIDEARTRFNWYSKPFNIVDDSFNVRRDRVVDFCDRLLKRGMKIQWFSSGFRADLVPWTMAEKMRDSGCIGVAVGIESANDDILKRMKKRATLAQIREGCHNLIKAGIPVTAQFMIGNPGDTYDTVMDSLRFARSQRFANVAFYLALPYPKTELWDHAVANGRFLKPDYTQFHHFASEPVFDTPEFPAHERAKAYKLARRLTLKTKLRHEIRTKLARIRRRDFTDLNPVRVRKAAERLSKYFLDLSLSREEKV